MDGNEPKKSTYGSLVVQPIELITEFNLDFCIASVIKWLTKWHMDENQANRRHYLDNAEYYVRKCSKMDGSDARKLMFALELYCKINNFKCADNPVYLIMQVVSVATNGMNDTGIYYIQCARGDFDEVLHEAVHCDAESLNECQ